MKKLLITAMTAISLTLSLPLSARAAEFSPEAYQAAQELLSHYKNLFQNMQIARGRISAENQVRNQSFWIRRY